MTWSDFIGLLPLVGRFYQEWRDRYLIIYNARERLVHVRLRFRTFTSEGTWKWYPLAQNGWYYFELSPGQSSRLFLDEAPVVTNAIRIRVHLGHARSTSRPLTFIRRERMDIARNPYRAFHRGEFVYCIFKKGKKKGKPGEMNKLLAKFRANRIELKQRIVQE
jgi:hypothetical protein